MEGNKWARTADIGKIASYGAIAVALIVIAFYTFNPKQEPTTDLSIHSHSKTIFWQLEEKLKEFSKY